MKRHLLEKHAEQFPESQIMIMVDICERPMDDDEDADCPICLATLSLSALWTHLAAHLEELALFVLPCHMEDRPQDVGSDKIEGATGQRLASNASSSEDWLPPLYFEKSLPDTSNSQDPEIFSTLLQSTMEFEHTDIVGWLLTNGETEQRDDGNGINYNFRSNRSQRNQAGRKNVRHANISVVNAEGVTDTSFSKGELPVLCSIHAMLISIRVPNHQIQGFQGRACASPTPLN